MPSHLTLFLHICIYSVTVIQGFQGYNKYNIWTKSSIAILQHKSCRILNIISMINYLLHDVRKHNIS